MGVSVEWIRAGVGIVRAGPKHNRLGDPYSAAMIVVQGDNPSVIVFKGLVAAGGIVAPETWKEVHRLLRERGYETGAREIWRDGRYVKTRSWSL